MFQTETLYTTGQICGERAPPPLLVLIRLPVAPVVPVVPQAACGRAPPPACPATGTQADRQPVGPGLSCPVLDKVSANRGLLRALLSSFDLPLTA